MDASRPATREASTIVALVHNGFTHDSRVRNEAIALANAGRRVVVAATAERGLPLRAADAGFEVVRVAYDPIDVRVWRKRDRAARPLRYRSTYVAWVRSRFAGPAGIVRGPLALIAGVLLLPWIAVAVAWRYAVRAADRLLRGRTARPPSRVVGGWIEQRMMRVVFMAHRPLRLRDWGMRIEAAVAAGDIPVADAWHAHDLETLPTALGLRRRFGGRVVFDSHEVFLEAAGRARMAAWRRWVLARLERRWAPSADAIVTVNDAVAEELARRYRVATPVVVRNCAPGWERPPGFRSPLLDAVEGVLDDPCLPIVLAHGTFHRNRGYEQLLEAAVDVPGLNVVFLGYGGQAEAYRAIAAAEPWRGRLAVLDAVPPAALLPWVAGASIGACLIQPTTLNHRLSTPNKLFEAIGAGIPVLAADLPAIASIVRSTGAGVLVDPTDIAAIRDALCQLVADADRRASLAAAAAEAARTELRWEIESRRLTALYDGLLGPAA